MLIRYRSSRWTQRQLLVQRLTRWAYVAFGFAAVLVLQIAILEVFF